MKQLFYKLESNVLGSFKGYNFLYHILAILLTYILVVTGFDWKYFEFFKGSRIFYILFSAAGVGAFMPVLAPLVSLVLGKIRKKEKFFNTGFALAQAAMIGLFISSTYKMLTGRAYPDLLIQNMTDVTHVFKFGFFRGGVFWGWPSSHTTIAFAMAFTLWAMYSKNKIIKALSLIYAMYIGLGVSMTIHWFSDFIAGAIIGIVIGTVVGKTFLVKEQTPVQTV